MSDTPAINVPGGLQDGPSNSKLDAVHRRRVLLKLSGEVFGGGSIGVDPNTVRAVAEQIAQAAAHVEIAIVVGGGNFFRGAELSINGMDRRRADYMGMLGTVMNALALQDFLTQAGVDTRVQSAINMHQVAEPYIPQRAIRHMQKGRVVIFGAGTGLPYFSTDTVAAQRALEIRADQVLMAKSGVDGVYTSDPKVDAEAKKFDHLTYDEAIIKNIRVMDLTAMTMCKDNNLDMLVFGMEGDGNVTRALLGESIGTVVTP
ncbi:UMP kinase [Enteractinococcus fodinae]|uniref:Uridylate kinase n=1 Tax=Enteractinococcus fodinae TaxID=684663 RepID=A0ABU2B1F8_9MICC|nr:uridylate kinase [Enteractinococcus fodinae]